MQPPFEKRVIEKINQESSYKEVSLLFKVRCLGFKNMV